MKDSLMKKYLLFLTKSHGLYDAFGTDKFDALYKNRRKMNPSKKKTLRHKNCPRLVKRKSRDR